MSVDSLVALSVSFTRSLTPLSSAAIERGEVKGPRERPAREHCAFFQAGDADITGVNYTPGEAARINYNQREGSMGCCVCTIEVCREDVNRLHAEERGIFAAACNSY